MKILRIIKGRPLNDPAETQALIYVVIRKTGLIILINLLFPKQSKVREWMIEKYWSFIVKFPKICFRINEKAYNIKRFHSNDFCLVDDFKSGYVYEIKDARVLGDSNIVFYGNDAYINPYIKIDNEIIPEEVSSCSISSNKKIIYKKQSEQVAIPTGALFNDRLSLNYAHWITEVLSRINLYCSNNEKELPLVILNGLPNAMYQSIDTIAPDRDVILVDPGVELNIEKCHWIYPTGYVPYSYRNWNIDRTDGIFSQESLSLLRNSVLGSVKSTDDKDIRLYIKRNSNYRRLLNSGQIEEYYRQQKFLIIEPEKLSFEEQVRLFSAADHIVGTTGAGMVNIMFTKPGCRIQILISDSYNHALGYWRNIAECTGNNIEYIFGKSENKKCIHSDYVIDKNNIRY